MREVKRACSRSAERVRSDEPAVGGQHQRLEVDVAEGVVAGQPVHALLAEDQQRVEAGRGHRREGRGLAGGELLRREVQVGAGHAARSLGGVHHRAEAVARGRRGSADRGSA